MAIELGMVIERAGADCRCPEVCCERYGGTRSEVKSSDPEDARSVVQQGAGPAEEDQGRGLFDARAGRTRRGRPIAYLVGWKAMPGEGRI